jgi:type VII secretion protein EssB
MKSAKCRGIKINREELYNVNKDHSKQSNISREDELVIREKKSSLNAKEGFDHKYLVRDEFGLIACRYEETEEEIIFTYDMKRLNPLEDIKKEPVVNQYRFLANIRTMRSLFHRYEIKLSEGNIYYDRSFMPHILGRDIRLSGAATMAEHDQRFLAEYKELAAGVLSRKYSLKQVRESGLEIIRRDKMMAPVVEAETIEGLAEHFEERWLALQTTIKNEKKLVDKGSLRLFRIIAIGAVTILLAGVSYTGYQTAFVLPVQAAVIAASRNYVVQDYPGCVEEMREVAIERMDIYTKYILAVSYAKNEMLTTEELSNIVERLNINSNEIELDYWIHLGRYEVEQAENIARALSDDKLLVYAYMKEINLLENNINIDGTEKQTRLTELNNEITAIGEKYLAEQE